MHVIGFGRRAREAYPEANRGASASLANRYLIDPAGPGTPSPFTAPTNVAAVNVTRRASGIFVVMVQLTSTLAGADSQEWAAVAVFGATASGGTPNGDWLLAIGSPITTTAPTSTFPMGVWGDSSSVGNLLKGVTLVGVNADPLPEGDSTILIAGVSAFSTQITPGPFLGVVYELP